MRRGSGSVLVYLSAAGVLLAVCPLPGAAQQIYRPANNCSDYEEQPEEDWCNDGEALRCAQKRLPPGLAATWDFPEWTCIPTSDPRWLVGPEEPWGGGAGGLCLQVYNDCVDLCGGDSWCRNHCEEETDILPGCDP